jgi:CheY-like chemotaxis protein
LKKGQAKSPIRKVRPKGVLIGPCLLAQDSLGYFLENGGLVDVILNTDDVTSALDAIERESPDIVVLDAEISPNSSTIVQDIVSTNGGTHVIILAASSHNSHVRDAVDAGASAYVEKSKVGTLELASVVNSYSSITRLESLEISSSAFFRSVMSLETPRVPYGVPSGPRMKTVLISAGNVVPSLRYCSTSRMTGVGGCVIVSLCLTK